MENNLNPLPSQLADINAQSPDLLLNEIDSRLVKIKPGSTPVDQITRLAGSRPAGSMVVDYYAVDTKEIIDHVASVRANDDYIMEDEDTLPAYFIRFKTVRVFNEMDTVLFPDLKCDPDFSLNEDGFMLVGYLSKKLDSPGDFLITFPQITIPIDDFSIFNGVKAVRMGRATPELQVQTPIFDSLPKKSTNFCQIFKSQIEQSTMVKIANKEVGWTFSDQEEVAVADMKRAMERNFIFGYRNRFTDQVRQEEIFFTGGIWNQAGKDFSFGEKVTYQGLVDLAKTVFVGNAGSNRRILLGGSGLISKLHALQDYSKVISARDYVTKWGIDFTEIHTKFGTFYVLLSETFDECGHSDDGMVIDPELMSKYVHIPFQTETLNLRSSGTRNVDAVVVTEASCVVLRIPDAHCRIRS